MRQQNGEGFVIKELFHKKTMVSLAKTSEVAGVTKGRKRGKIANLYQWVEKRSKRKERESDYKKNLGKSSRVDITLQNTSNLLCYLTVCLLKLFYTFQFGQSDKEHSDPVAIPLAQHF